MLSRVSDPILCPSCGVALDPVVPPACPACGVRLKGPDAVRLWQVDRLIASLEVERTGLLERLRLPESEVVAQAAAGQAGLPVVRTRRSLSAQQVLLTLGSLLLLSASAFFVLVAWLVVGVAGQAVILAGLIAVAVFASNLATRHGLAATAEAAAVLAVGLSWIAAGAAHHLDVAGTGSIDLAWFWTGAHAVLAVLFLGFDRVVRRRRTRDGVEVRLRRIVTYRPAAALAAALVPWCALPGLDLSTTLLVAGFGVVALLDGVLCLGIRRRSDSMAAAVVPAAPALLGAAAFWVVGCVQAFDVTEEAGSRYGAAALLAVPAVLAGLVALSPVAGRLSARLRAGLPVAAAVAATPTALTALLDLGQVGIVVAAALASSVVPWLWRRSGTSGSLAQAGIVLLTFVQAATSVIAVALVDADASSVRSAVSSSSSDAAAAPLPVLIGLLPLLGWALSAVASAWRVWPARLAHAQLVLCQLLLLLGALVLMDLGGGLSDGAVLATVTALAAVDLLASWWLARLMDRAAADVRRSWRWAEAVTASGAALLIVLAVVEGASGSSPGWAVASCWWALAVALFCYASAPRRFVVAYVGAVLAGLAWLALLDAAADDYAVELLTLPCAVLLAVLGLLQVRLAVGHQVPTVLSAGPALAVALLPSAVAVDDVVRLLAVVAVGVVLVAVGYLRSWQAPILVGGLVLAWVAVVQGGPYLSYVPTWLTLGAAGALLLTAGVMWERAVATGRRSAAWFATLA
jgi:hypothetical protein